MYCLTLVEIGLDWIRIDEPRNLLPTVTSRTLWVFLEVSASDLTRFGSDTFPSSVSRVDFHALKTS